MSDANLIRRMIDLIALLAVIQENCDDGSSVDEAFIWEPSEIARRPLVTFRILREARAIGDALRGLPPRAANER